MRVFARLVLVSSLLIAAPALAQAPVKKPSTTATGDLGFVSSTGNTQLTTLSVGEQVNHANGRFVFSQLGVYVYGATKGVQSAGDLRLAIRSDVAWAPRFGGFVGVAYENNRYAGYKRRTDEIFGVLWRALAEPTDELNVDIGGVFSQKKNVDGTQLNTPFARGAATYKHNVSKTSYFAQNAEYLPDLKTNGEFRLNTESSLVAPISAHVGVKMSYVVRYDSHPPVNFGTTDKVFTTGIQVSY